MIIDQFNTTLSGGAAIAARRLHHALLKSGNTSRFWYLDHRRQSFNGDESYTSAGQLWRGRHHTVFSGLRKQIHKLKVRYALRGRPSGLEIFSSSRAYPPTQVDINKIESDIIHLHWIVKLIDYPSFFGSIPDELPIVWTLHDMNPFTGGCHHADACQKFTSICQNCPQLGRSSVQDLSRQTYEIKKKAFERKNIHIVTPSRWLESQVRESSLLGSATSIQTIHNGLDTEIFTPRDRVRARKRFGLGQSDFVIGCAAAHLTNVRKGFREFLDAYARLRHRKQCVALAMGEGETPMHESGVLLQTTGYLEKPSDVADFYSALDAFVITSKAENMPQTVVEAMACGVPTVGFAVGGIPEIVQPGRTGLLSTVGDCQGIANDIDSLIEWPERRRQMGAESRKLAVQEFDERKQLQKYLELYRQASNREVNAAPRGTAMVA
ncbi:MAG: hypothetical protein CMJ74_09875 [Planctomycetaceae bacterium]|nr:hypothetical protein [Planctomycetaceae bacterium]|tara:strand:+ start:697 stop:2007 length:1311 start_codon:yes stop_codon:yes gene_type:complete